MKVARFTYPSDTQLKPTFSVEARHHVKKSWIDVEHDDEGVRGGRAIHSRAGKNEPALRSFLLRFSSFEGQRELRRAFFAACAGEEWRKGWDSNPR